MPEVNDNLANGTGRPRQEHRAPGPAHSFRRIPGTIGHDHRPRLEGTSVLSSLIDIRELAQARSATGCTTAASLS